MTNEEIVVRILVGSLIGALIGSERKQSKKPAGITTHLVVCLGATLVTIIQSKIDLNTIKLLSEHPELLSAVKSDPTRIPAQIVSGIGFLGGGVILHSKDTVSGITTAATIWITACLGIGVGYGFFEIVIPATIVLLIALYILKKHGIFSELAEEAEKAKVQ